MYNCPVSNQQARELDALIVGDLVLIVSIFLLWLVTLWCYCK
jgi:hypothetical protein